MRGKVCTSCIHELPKHLYVQNLTAVGMGYVETAYNGLSSIPTKNFAGTADSL